MHAHAGQPNPMIGYAISAVVILLVMAFRFRSTNRVRPLRLERLWIVPVLYGVFTVVMFEQYPPPPLGWALSVTALAVGAVLGWHRGKMMRIGIDPDTHALNQTQAHVGAMMVTGALIALALGVIAASRAEMFLRARRLLADTRSIKMT
jgi:hypothetical protein